MSLRVSASTLAAFLAFVPGVLRAQAPEIDHKPIGCIVNGQAVQVARGASQAAAAARGGDNLVEAQLVETRNKPGTWRFEVQEAEDIEPGSFRVLRGAVALVTPTAVVFRLTGQRGEEVAFSYRLRR